MAWASLARSGGRGERAGLVQRAQLGALELAARGLGQRPRADQGDGVVDRELVRLGDGAADAPGLIAASSAARARRRAAPGARRPRRWLARYRRATPSLGARAEREHSCRTTDAGDGARSAHARGLDGSWLRPLHDDQVLHPPGTDVDSWPSIEEAEVAGAQERAREGGRRRRRACVVRIVRAFCSGRPGVAARDAGARRAADLADLVVAAQACPLAVVRRSGSWPRAQLAGRCREPSASHRAASRLGDARARRACALALPERRRGSDFTPRPTGANEIASVVSASP